MSSIFFLQFNKSHCQKSQFSFTLSSRYVRCGSSSRFVRLRDRDRWQHLAPRIQRAVQPRPPTKDAGQHEVQVDRGQWATRAKIRILDRRIDPGVIGKLPADVDLEAGVRRRRKESSWPEVPLNEVKVVKIAMYHYLKHQKELKGRKLF